MQKLVTEVLKNELVAPHVDFFQIKINLLLLLIGYKNILLHLSKIVIDTPNNVCVAV